MRGWAGGLDKVGEGGVERWLMAFVASEADRSLAKVFIAVLAGCLLTELKSSLENHCISGFYHHNPVTIFGTTVWDNFW